MWILLLSHHHNNVAHLADHLLISHLSGIYSVQGHHKKGRWLDIWFG